ncbi:hypothetical protein HWV62_30135 [Athelia sp. TMB]|nr:hypothetical protein HWV62_30135 [Athelia sp. TMB]
MDRCGRLRIFYDFQTKSGFDALIPLLALGRSLRHLRLRLPQPFPTTLQIPANLTVLNLQGFKLRHFPLHLECIRSVTHLRMDHYNGPTDGLYNVLGSILSCFPQLSHLEMIELREEEKQSSPVCISLPDLTYLFLGNVKYHRFVRNVLTSILAPRLETLSLESYIDPNPLLAPFRGPRDTGTYFPSLKHVILHGSMADMFRRLPWIGTAFPTVERLTCSQETAWYAHSKEKNALNLSDTVECVLKPWRTLPTWEQLKILAVQEKPAPRMRFAVFNDGEEEVSSEEEEDESDIEGCEMKLEDALSRRSNQLNLVCQVTEKHRREDSSLRTLLLRPSYFEKGLDEAMNRLKGLYKVGPYSYSEPTRISEMK